MSFISKLAATILSAVALAGTAHASVGVYSVSAHSTEIINITASNNFCLTIHGHGHTDIDYRLISPVGRPILVDVDRTSWTSKCVTIDRAGVYRLYVQNLGDHDNSVVLRLD